MACSNESVMGTQSRLGNSNVLRHLLRERDRERERERLFHPFVTISFLFLNNLIMWYSGYDTESLIESLASTSITQSRKTPQLVSCKSHPITTIRCNLEETRSEKNVSETCLNPKFLAHILSHQDCLEAVNRNLRNDLSLTIRQVSGDYSALEVSVERDVAENSKLEEMYDVIEKHCREHLKISEHDMDEERFSFAELKLGKFLKGMRDPHCISIFFDGKVSLAGHEADITVFENDLLSSILNDEVVRDSFSIKKEQLHYLNVICYRDEISNDFSVEVDLEEEDESGTVTLHGLREDVVNVQRNISRCLQNYHKRFWTRLLTRNELCLLQEKKAIRYFKGVFKKNKCSHFIAGQWLRVASKKGDIDTLKTKLENELFVQINHSLSKLEKNIFESEQWVKRYNILRNNTNKQVIITVEGSELLVTCLPHVKILVESFLESFLRETIESELIEWGCTAEVKDLFQAVKHEEIVKILTSMEDSIMEISMEEDGILVKGTESGIEKCKQELKTIISTVKYRKGEFAAASEEVVNHFLTSEGKRKLQEIGKKTHSVIHVNAFCQIKMEQGNIAEDKGDAIVNSVHTNTSTTAAQSTVAGAIFEKGGGEFQNKLVQKTNGKMQCREVVETKAVGNLQCKAVYHACLPESSDQPQKDVRDIAMECLRKAARDNHTSISFPALGTGTYNYPADLATKGLLDAIVEFTRNTTSSLEKVTIVLFGKSKTSVKEAFQQEYQRRCQTMSGSSIPTLERGCITSGKFTIVSESQQNLTEAKRYLEEEIATI